MSRAVVTRILGAITAVHVIALELVILGWWRPAHVDGLVMLTLIFTVATVVMATAPRFD